MQPNPRSRRVRIHGPFLLLVLCVTCLSGLVGALPAGAAASTTLQFTVEPAALPPSDARRGYFVVATQPGVRVTRALELRNVGKVRQRLHIGVDLALTGPIGGVSYATSGNARDSVLASTIELERESVDLAPGQAVTVPFGFTLPQGTRPGTYLAGITVEQVDTAPASGPRPRGRDASNTTGLSTAVHTRRVIAVEATVGTPPRAELRIQGVRAIARPAGAILQVAVENVGHSFTKGSGVIEVSGGFSKQFAIGTFVPGTAIDFPLPWQVDPPSGEYDATVTIKYDGGIATWRGSFHVRPSLQAELRDRSTHVAARESNHWVAIAAITILAMIVAVIVGLVVRRRTTVDYWDDELDLY